MMDISMYKYNMSIWLILLTIYVASSVSSGQPALSVNVTLTNGSVSTFMFNDTMFERLYHCLRNINYNYCDVKRSTIDPTVETVSGCQLGQGSGDITRCASYTHSTSVHFHCGRGDNDYTLPHSVPSDCLQPYNTTDGSLNLLVLVQITWFGVVNVTMESQGHGIKINLQSKTFLITGTFISATTTTTTITTTAAAATPSPPPPKTTMASTITTTRTTASPDQSSKHISPDSSSTTATTTGGPGTDKLINENDDNNNLAIVVGLAVGCIVVVVIIAIIIVLFWRRKKRTASSSSTNNSRNDDNTDIYPYGDSTLNNVMPNVSSNTLNTNPNEPKPETYATVDSSRKLSKTKTSSDTRSRSRSSAVNNNNGNKSKQKKTRLSPNLDYTEVDINNGAVHYQRTSDDNNGQEIPTSETPPPLPPDPSAKPKYYNEVDEDSSKAYTQVVKKNKNKDKSAASEKGAGSNPAHNPSGYEEVAPHTDTQYATVDPSVNTTLKLTTDGVYAKLHDPVRNITDVYNEVPAEVTC